ncbi:tetratricopeptide repeat protein [Scytonema sp. UIC 10036]|uniref:serine/threonine-protein kinase n=1 Tax=Scytonema sp. UIC 10036 TaxID=2304196 RepID=UPI0012DA55D2|nr:serine/threonine-protein kinase [Scytonema sp. UIC 10036]MUG92405.1 tetratricopeptide repeat protein [Scytonema sp. UIC 10036]
MTQETKGLIVGRYQLVKEIARGGFGVTYLAQDIVSSNSPCVVKKLNPQNADIETAKILFQREAQTLNFLQRNQQIPKFLNYFEEGQNYYLVQEYIQGQSLDKLLERRWEKQKVINFLQEMLFILNSLHKINIIHRDIKPSNVIRRDEDKKFILIDFGSVKQLEQQDLSLKSGQQLVTHTMIGTPGYAPTEQMDGRPSFNSDIYGLGMTAIHLLTGIHPRDLKRDEQDNVKFPKGVEPDDKLSKILTKMVHFSTERRYQTVDEVIENLSEITVQANGVVKNWTPNLPETKINVTPVSITQNDRTLLPSQIWFKPWYTAIGLLAISLFVIFIEFLIHPFIRPFYYLYQGNRLLDLRQPEAASEEFENIIAIAPNSFEAWKGRGDSLFSLGRYPGALSAYEKALFYKPNDLKTLNSKGRALYKLQKYQETLETYEKVLKLDPNNAEGWSGKGIAYMSLRQYKEATNAFQKLRQIRPDIPNIWYEIGLAVEPFQGAQTAKEYFKEALWLYNNFIKKHPDALIELSDRGNVLQKLNMLPEALDSYEKALKIDRNFYEALFGKGNILFRMGKYEESLLAFNQASQIRPQDDQIWYARGILLARHFQKHEEALKSFGQAIQLRSDFYPTWQEKGLVLYDLERYEEALASFNKAKELAPDNPYVWANLWSALEKLGKIQEAQQAKDKAIALGFPPEQFEQSQNEK